MTPTVYLAGPITGLTYDDGQEWRDHARAVLRSYGIEAYSPLRAKEYLRDHGVLDAGGSDSSYADIALSSSSGIVTRDRMDCTTRDLVLANLTGAERVSIGTAIECGWADAARVPIVCAMEDGNVHDHAMIRGLAGFIVPTLEEAVEVAAAILLP